MQGFLEIADVEMDGSIILRYIRILQSELPSLTLCNRTGMA